MRTIWRWLLLGGLVAPGGMLPAQSWQRVATPAFTIYSGARPDETRRIAEEFQQFIMALDEFVPLDTRRLPPLTLVIFGHPREFERFWPLLPSGRRWPLEGFFTRRAGWSVAGLGGGRFFNDSVRSTIFHEGVHWYLSAFDDNNPLWLDEGLAELFSTFSVHRGKVQWGRVIDHHAAVLQHLKLAPMEQILLVSRSDPLYNELQRTGIFYAQSWLFVHYWVFGAHKQSPAALDNYLRGYRAGLAPRDAFTRAFGASYEEVENQLKAYVRGGRYYVPSRPVRPTTVTFTAEPATEHQVTLALGRLALGANDLALAQQYLDPLLKEETKDPEVYELQGALANARDDNEGVIAAYEHAIGLGSKNHWVFFELAERWRQQGGISGGPMDDATARRIAYRYESAIERQPQFLPAYQGLARILSAVDSFNRRDWLFLELGAKFYPADPTIQAGMAILERKAGHQEQAFQRLAAARERSPAPRDAEEVAALKYLEILEDTWKQEDLGKNLQALLEENRPGEALTLLEDLVAGPLTVDDRHRWAQLRRQVVPLVLLKAMAAMEERRWDEARDLFERLRPATERSVELKRDVDEHLARIHATQQELPAASDSAERDRED